MPPLRTLPLGLSITREPARAGRRNRCSSVPNPSTVGQSEEAVAAEYHEVVRLVIRIAGTHGKLLLRQYSGILSLSLNMSTHNRPPATDVERMMQDLTTGNVSPDAFCQQFATLAPEGRAQLVAEMFRLRAVLDEAGAPSQ